MKSAIFVKPKFRVGTIVRWVRKTEERTIEEDILLQGGLQSGKEDALIWSYSGTIIIQLGTKVIAGAYSTDIPEEELRIIPGFE